MPARAKAQPMNIALHKSWTQEEFFSWAEGQEGRFEFDGFQPVSMTGGTVNHGIIMRNLHRSLDSRLRGSKCLPYGPDVGINTVGSKVRYPDALVTCLKQSGIAKTVTGVVIAFEIVSSGDARTDRIVKVQEYAAVSSIIRYVMIESTSRGLLSLHRDAGESQWRAAAMTEADMLCLPEVGIEFPVAELYDGVELENDEVR